MRDVAVVGGVLGTGCVIVFALAAAVSMLFPSGTMVSPNPWGGKGGVFMDAPIPIPAVAPMIIEAPADGAAKAGDAA